MLAELVVFGAVLFRAQHRIRFVDFLHQAMIHVLVFAAVKIGMMFAGESAVRFFDLVFGRGARNAEDVVVIAKRLGHVCTSCTFFRPC